MLQWSRRLASCYVSTFPSAPPRTGRAPFGAPGSPVSSAIVDDPQDGFGVSHLAYLPARVSGHLPPFPVWTAFPPSEYYGGSVALQLRGASGDPTFPWCWTCRARQRCLVRPLEWDDVPSPTAWKVRATTTLPPYHGGPAVRRCVGDVRLHRWRLRFEQSSP